MAVDFTPTMEEYSGQGKFRYWVQMVLPTIYDDSLSYMELLNKVVYAINLAIEDVGAVEDNVAALLTSFEQLQQFTNDYFDNLDVQEEINNKLDEMASDGTLSNLIEPYLIEYQNQLNTLEARVNNLTETITEGGTTGDAEVVDARVNYMGVTYDNSGNAIRSTEQNIIDYIVDNSEVNGSVNYINNYGVLSGVLDDTGQVISSDTYKTIADFIPISEGETIVLHYPKYSSPYTLYRAYYDENKNVLQSLNFTISNSEYYWNVPSGAKYCKFSLSNTILQNSYIIKKFGVGINTDFNNLNEFLDTEIMDVPDTWYYGTVGNSGEITPTTTLTRMVTDPINTTELDKLVIHKLNDFYRVNVLKYRLPNGKAYLGDGGWTSETEIDLTDVGSIRLYIGTSQNSNITPEILDAYGFYLIKKKFKIVDNLISLDDLKMGYYNTAGGVGSRLVQNNSSNADERTTKKYPLGSEGYNLNFKVTVPENNSYWSALCIWENENLIYRDIINDSVIPALAGSGEKEIKIHVPYIEGFTHFSFQARYYGNGKITLCYGDVINNLEYEDYNNKNVDKFSFIKNKSVNHMGYNSIAPANTLPAFIESFKHGFKIVECDLQFTSDNIPVICHDAIIDNYSDGTGTIKNMTYQELLDYDFGSWFNPSFTGTKICSLEELLVLCKNTDMCCYLELKGDSQMNDDDALAVDTLIKKYNMYENVTFISFNNDLLSKMKMLNNKVRLGFLINTTNYSDTIFTRIFTNKTKHNNIFLDLNFNNSSINNWIEACKNNNVDVEVWTVNSEQAILDLNKYITGVTSNRFNYQTVLDNQYTD